MGLKTSIPVRFEATTTDGTTYVPVASFSFPTNCSFILDDIFLLGKTTNGTVGETGYAKAIHRGKVTTSGGIALVGAPVYVVTFPTGSEYPMVSCVLRVTATQGLGAIAPFITLEVRGLTGRNISWYGGFTVIMH